MEKADHKRGFPAISLQNRVLGNLNIGVKQTRRTRGELVERIKRAVMKRKARNRENSKWIFLENVSDLSQQ